MSLQGKCRAAIALAVAILASVVVASPTRVAVASPASASGTFPEARSSAPNELSIVSINAQQQERDLDDSRLSELADAIRRGVVDPSDGREVAPDVIVINELYYTQTPKLESYLNSDFAGLFDCSAATKPCPYHLIGSNFAMAAKLFINMKTVELKSVTTWQDPCDSTRNYEMAQLSQISTGKTFTVAGLHLSKNYSSPEACRRSNVDLLRSQLGSVAAPIFVAGDFNKRAMTKERECDLEEKTATLSWWNDMTATSSVDGHSFKDSVREWDRANGLPMANEFTHEQFDVSTLCNGVDSYKRGRIDYIFSSEGTTILEAHADRPGWSDEAHPGSTVCTSDRPSCRYSDHRFVWGRFGIGLMPPPTPTGVTATPLSSSQIEVTWRDVRDESSYAIERSSDGSQGTWTSVGAASQDVTRFVDSGLSPNSTYQYRIIATNGTGSSLPSAPAAATTKAGDPPASPSGVTATAPSSTRVDLTWTDGAAETGYTVERSAGSGSWTSVGQVGADVTAFVDTTVRPSTRYDYRIYATNGYGSSPASATAGVTTPPDSQAPSTPQNLRATGAKRSISLSWDPSTDQGGSGLASYEVWRRQSNQQNFSLVARTANRTYSDGSVKPGQQYFYYVVAVDGAGNRSSASNTASAKPL